MSDVAERGGERVAFVMTQQLEIAPGDFDKLSDIYTGNHRSPPPQNSHSLAPVFAVLSVLGLIDDGRLQDFDRVPGASGDNAAVTAGGRVQDNACRFMEATPN